jgi:FkbM family methyltransferase
MKAGTWVEIRYQTRKYRLATFGSHDIVNRSYQRGHFYEEELLTKIAEINRSGVYFDVGSHIGNHTLFFAKECPSTLVMGFEPGKLPYRLSLLTIEANQATEKVRLLNLPVSEKDGKLVSYFSPDSQQNTGSGYVQVSEPDESAAFDSVISRLVKILPFFSPAPRRNTDSGRSRKGEKIRSVSIDGFVSRLDKTEPIAVLKVDVEGSEMRVLSGARSTIEQWRPVVIVETKTTADRLQTDRLMIEQNHYVWAGQYCATPTQLYMPQGKSSRKRR